MGWPFTNLMDHPPTGSGSPPTVPSGMTQDHPDIHRNSYLLGMINAFAEMVAVGLKPLAISPPLTPVEYEAVRTASEAIVEGSGILSFLETSLLITDLQSPEFTEGKWSILYFQEEETLAAYRNLKERKRMLEARGSIPPEDLREISREFMRLLGYPAETIERKLAASGTDDPFMLLQED